MVMQAVLCVLFGLDVTDDVGRVSSPCKPGLQQVLDVLALQRQIVGVHQRHRLFSVHLQPSIKISAVACSQQVPKRLVTEVLAASLLPRVGRKAILTEPLQVTLQVVEPAEDCLEVRPIRVMTGSIELQCSTARCSTVLVGRRQEAQPAAVRRQARGAVSADGREQLTALTSAV